MMAKCSIVQYFGGDSEGHRCGYCKSSNTNYSHGMWAHEMTCLDYQDLIDRGWRRSGKYVYKPTMKKLCCPMYTIKCDAMAFHPSKSQKKVLKKMTKFLTVPVTEPHTSQADDKGIPSESHEFSRTYFVEPLLDKIPSEAAKMKDINTDKLKEKDFKGVEHFGARKFPTDSQMPSCSGQTTKPDELVKKTECLKEKTPVPGKGPDPNKPPCKKAKILRMERKKQKLALAKEKGIEDTSSHAPKVPISKSLEDLVIDRLPNQRPVHDLLIKLIPSDPSNPEFQKSFPQTAALFFKYQRAVHKDPPEKCTERRVKLVRVNMRSEEFQATYKQTCNLFAKYQMAIHKDSPGECDELQFRRFLVDSPLEHYTGPGSPPMGFGSFHQQYFVDGKLVAVGVIDILPRCVSSVYLFYDPDYSFLSLGVYSALRELHFTRSLQRATASIRSYYMGFYIHSCPKMRYKGQYNPSYLLCPETYNWVPIEQCRPKLDHAKYARLEDTDEEAPSADTYDVLVLFDHNVMPYQMYAAISRANDHEEVQEYAGLMGPAVCSRMLLFRSG